MPRTKPIKKLDSIGKLGKNPEDAVGAFHASKKQDKYFVKPPNWDSPGDSAELLLLESQREYSAMLCMQQEMLENDKRKATVNKNRKGKLEQDLAELRKRFINANYFIKDCNEKKIIADKKIDEQVHVHEQLHGEIEKSEQSIAKFSGFRETFKTTVEEYKHYETLLEDVVAAKPEIYSSIKDCTDRCDALMVAQEEIVAVNQQKMREIDEMRQFIVQSVDQAMFTMMGMRNELAAIERAFQAANTECLKWESILANAKDSVAENEMIKERTNEGLRDIYLVLCRRREIEPVYQRSESEKMADFIKDEVEFLGNLLQDLEIKSGGARSNLKDLC